MNNSVELDIHQSVEFVININQNREMDDKIGTQTTMLLVRARMKKISVKNNLMVNFVQVAHFWIHFDDSNNEKWM